jgi:hypothetical protein
MELVRFADARGPQDVKLASKGAAATDADHGHFSITAESMRIKAKDFRAFPIEPK